MKTITLVLSLMAVSTAWSNDAKPAAHGSEKPAEKKEAKPAEKGHGETAKPAAKNEHGAAAKAEAKPAAAAHGEAKKPEEKKPDAAHAEAKKPAAAHSAEPVKPAPKPAFRAAAKARVAPRAAVPVSPVMSAGNYPAGSYVLVPAASFMAAQSLIANGAIPIQMMGQSGAAPMLMAAGGNSSVDAHGSVHADPSADHAPAAVPQHHIAAPAGPPVVTAEEALNELKKGNERHVESDYNHENHSHRRLEEVAKGQQPHAVILTCSDSRLPPELIFDKGLGDLFVIRVAGNVAGDSELGSIEYAAEHLNVPLVIVMGHKRCGAVQAAAGGGDPGGHISSLVKQIQPAVQKAKGMAGDLVDNAVHTNVDLVVRNLRNSGPILRELVESGRLKVLGAYYDIDSGKVDWMY